MPNFDKVTTFIDPDEGGTDRISFVGPNFRESIVFSEHSPLMKEIAKRWTLYNSMKEEIDYWKNKVVEYSTESEDRYVEISKLKARIEELENPNLYHKDEWHEDYGDVIWYSEDDYPPIIDTPLCTSWEEDEMQNKKYNFFQLMPSLTHAQFKEAQETLNGLESNN